MTDEQLRRKEAIERVVQLVSSNVLSSFTDENGYTHFIFNVTINSFEASDATLRLAEKLADLYEFMSTYL